MVEDIQNQEQEVKQEEAKQEEKQQTSSVELGEKEKKIIEEIESLSVLELANLVKALEEKFGVSAAMPVMGVAAGVPAGGGAATPEAEEKTTFDVILAEVGNNKIQVIKEVRAVTNLGLKEAKELVESAPKPVVTGIKKEEAEEIKKKLEAVGAKVELK